MEWSRLTEWYKKKLPEAMQIAQRKTVKARDQARSCKWWQIECKSMGWDCEWWLIESKCTRWDCKCWLIESKSMWWVVRTIIIVKNFWFQPISDYSKHIILGMNFDYKLKDQQNLLDISVSMG